MSPNAAIPSLMPTYGRIDLSFERGEGAWLYTHDGRRFLDFTSGVAVNGLGHCHPHLVSTLQKQAAKLWHASNLFRIDELERLADRLVAHSFAETVFVCNSGAEAMEACIKVARRFHFCRGQPERNRIITFEGGFHGRTMATISAAGGHRLTEGFAPLLDGFDHVPFARSRRAGGGRHRADGSDHDRAGHGRRRRPADTKGLPRRPARTLRPARHPA